MNMKWFLTALLFLGIFSGGIIAEEKQDLCEQFSDFGERLVCLRKLYTIEDAQLELVYKKSFEYIQNSHRDGHPPACRPKNICRSDTPAAVISNITFVLQSKENVSKGDGP